MIIAAAQTIPKNENISGNLEDHIRLIRLAASHGAQLILFPELSITGYVREKAEILEFVTGDPRINDLRSLSISENIIIIAGAPIRLDSGLHIGAFVLFPDQSEIIYTKQYLHDGEEIYYMPGNHNGFQIRLDNESIALAICADITNSSHAIKAASLNSSIYLASLFYTPNGISEGYEMLQQYAKELSMSVLMSNFGGLSYALEAAGKSAFWNNEGELIASFDGIGEGLLIVSKKNNYWNAEVIKTL
jgi:predicted amidohydrolase